MLVENARKLLDACRLLLKNSLCLQLCGYGVVAVNSWWLLVVVNS